MKLTKDVIARMCQRAGMQPEIRTSFKHYDVFVADGFTAVPEFTLRRFGVEKGDFPFGAHATLWAVAKGEDHIEVAGILTEKPLVGDGAQAKRDRLRAALLAAGKFILGREKHKGIKLNA